MATEFMTPASAGNIASSAEYNKLITNILDLNDRLGPVVAGSNAHTRLNTLESRTTDTVTTGGIGNQRLADRLGTGVGTGTNVTTGSATSQLTDLRSRASALETLTGHASHGNIALDARVDALEAASGSFQAPTGRAYATVSQSVTTAGVQATLSTTEQLRGMTFSSGVFTISAGSAGLYLINGVHALLNGQAGVTGISVQIFVNGALYPGSEESQGYASGVFNSASTTRQIRLAVGDTVALRLMTASAAGNSAVLSNTGNRLTSRLELTWIAA